MALSDSTVPEGASVEVRRPSDYNPSLAAALGLSQPNPNLNLGAVGLSPASAAVLEGPDCIYVGNIPHSFTEKHLRELLECCGPLRGFDFVKDWETGDSIGYAFCVYQDLSDTDLACICLDGMKTGEKMLIVRRANQSPILPTKVVCLTNAVTADDLKEDEEFENILEDMRIALGIFGKLVNVVINRGNPSEECTAGAGKVFLEYEDTVGAAKARSEVHGRRYAGNHVVAEFYPETKFARGEYDG